MEQLVLRNLPCRCIIGVQPLRSESRSARWTPLPVASKIVGRWPCTPRAAPKMSLQDETHDAEDRRPQAADRTPQTADRKPSTNLNRRVVLGGAMCAPISSLAVCLLLCPL
jgi:hypothetical protein